MDVLHGTGACSGVAVGVGHVITRSNAIIGDFSDPAAAFTAGVRQSSTTSSICRNRRRMPGGRQRRPCSSDQSIRVVHIRDPTPLCAASTRHEGTDF